MTWAVCRLVARNLLENHLARLAVSDFGGVHDPGAVLRIHHNPVQKHKHGQRKVQIEQRFRRRELEDAALLIETVEAGGAQFNEARFEGFGERRFGSWLGGSFGGRFQRAAHGLRFSHRRNFRSAHRKQCIEPRPLAQR